ncbi:hypothetical protein ABZ606_12655 [Streptomyces sp. NPDC012461]|jgi:hypothetical protein|uniref:Uncharacterized protein n=2 Tax=unclassified Streptomyces TaxID=2593676 RepID=A0A6G3QWS4_9ACTN|nr:MULTISPECIES: hypothetical protein [unclassified Streptomyces]NEA87916.1 hypothetical protein [Streptomyces sp. SID14436]NEC80110.1 hypothetical protein [Streptomyces sp. SID7958]
MVMTGKQKVLYRQGTGFWRMTAKWVVVFGALAVLDGGLLRSWGDALVWPLIGLMLWLPFGVGVVWYPKKDQRVKLTVRDLRVRRKRLPMEKVNLLHVARLWLEGRSTADEQPVREWARRDRVVWVPLRDGRAFGVECRDPAAFAEVFGAFAVEACGGPDIVRARAAAETYPEPRPVRPRPAEGGGSSWADVLDVFG